jgi:hypothetical protein
MSAVVIKKIYSKVKTDSDMKTRKGVG